MMIIRKKINSRTKAFQDSTGDAREKVEQWPSWKRNLKVTQYSVRFDSKFSETSASDSCGFAKDK
jgi:hypothetical protein